MREIVQEEMGAADGGQKHGFLHRFLQLASSHPDTVAIHLLDEEVRITYAELRAQAELMSGALDRLNVKTGARVILLLPNGLALVAMYLATIGSGAIPVMINDKLTVHEFTALASDAVPSVVVTTAQLLIKHRGVLASIQSLLTVATIDTLPELAVQPSFKVVNLTTLDATPIPLRLPEDNAVVTIQYTYKGLGEPLPVAHRYRSLTISSDGLHEQFYPQGSGSTHLVALPLYAVFGLCVQMVFPLSIGATMLMTNMITHLDIVEVMSKHRVTFTCLVPDVIRFFILQLAKRQTPLPKLDPNMMIYSGGSSLSADMAEELGKYLGRPPVLQGYGLTESLPILLQSTIGVTKAGAMGKPISNIEVQIVDDLGVAVDVGCTGELVVRGPTISGEYHGKPHATSRFFRDGWLHTGDLVWRDEDGHIFFVGQRLRITKIKAQMVDLAEVELVAALHPGVQRARVRVVRDEQGRNGLHLSVACTPDSSKDSILKHLKTRLSAFKVPRIVELDVPRVREAS